MYVTEATGAGSRPSCIVAKQQCSSKQTEPLGYFTPMVKGVHWYTGLSPETCAKCCHRRKVNTLRWPVNITDRNPGEKPGCEN